ncbi:hypothetical protein [Psychrobacter maritimus]
MLPPCHHSYHSHHPTNIPLNEVLTNDVSPNEVSPNEVSPN